MGPGAWERELGRGNRDTAEWGWGRGSGGRTSGLSDPGRWCKCRSFTSLLSTPGNPTTPHGPLSLSTRCFSPRPGVPRSSCPPPLSAWLLRASTWAWLRRTPCPCAWCGATCTAWWATGWRSTPTCGTATSTGRASAWSCTLRWGEAGGGDIEVGRGREAEGRWHSQYGRGTRRGMVTSSYGPTQHQSSDPVPLPNRSGPNRKGAGRTREGL